MLSKCEKFLFLLVCLKIHSHMNRRRRRRVRRRISEHILFISLLPLFDSLHNLVIYSHCCILYIQVNHLSGSYKSIHPIVVHINMYRSNTTCGLRTSLSNHKKKLIKYIKAKIKIKTSTTFTRFTRLCSFEY